MAFTAGESLGENETKIVSDTIPHLLCPPEINPHLTNRSLSYNSSLQFNCSQRGFPKPEVLWTKDGVNIGNKNTFTIRQARLEDSGQYTCSATNSLGNKTSTIWIEIIG
ncbi:fibroblast growth factor receptor-like 1, partial [Stylophora pistillata]|uniref:fibroblast growth factor receptor-like 1 n=1 Tax=Stylophora pistillata TaxID=50429 RepID=UPI000C050CE8